MHQPTDWQPATRARAAHLSPTVREFELEPEGGVQPWTVGQPPPGAAADRRPASTRAPTRWSAAARRPTAYRIAVKRVERQPRRLARDVAAGSRRRARGRGAAEPLRAARSAPPQSLLVAGGIGITPLLGMALTLAARGADFALVHAARTRDELVYTQALAGSLRRALALPRVERAASASTSTPRSPRCTARAAAALRAGAACSTPHATPGRAPAGRRTCCASRPSAPAARLAAQAFWVRCRATACEFVVPADRSLLDVLEQHGVETLSDCRRGECGLCALDVDRAARQRRPPRRLLQRRAKSAKAGACAPACRAWSAAASCSTPTGATTPPLPDLKRPPSERHPPRASRAITLMPNGNIC